MHLRLWSEGKSALFWSEGEEKIINSSDHSPVRTHSQILLLECLTDPSGKSFTLHLPRRRVPRGVILSTCLRLSSVPTSQNCSLCSCSPVLFRQKEICHFFLTSPPLSPGSPEARHQRSFENYFTGVCSHARRGSDSSKSQGPHCTRLALSLLL